MVFCIVFGGSIGFLQFQADKCSPITTLEPQLGKHGFIQWQNQSYISFVGTSTPYCIPAGFEPLTDESDTIIQDGKETTTVFIRTEHFKQTYLTLHDQPLRVVYHHSLSSSEVLEYTTLISNVYSKILTLYPTTTATSIKEHTVLIAEGIAGDGTTSETSVHPSPSKKLTTFVRSKRHWRGEELFIHAVTHQINRYTDSDYQFNQAPIPPTEWEELEASWAELAFLSDGSARSRRIDALYAIHTAVQTKNYTEGLEYPFHQASVFKTIGRTSLMLSTEPTYAEIEYSHYVLAPLFLVAVDGLLAEYAPEIFVSDLLMKVHQENSNFFTLLSQKLPEDELDKLFNYLYGNGRIPYEILQKGVNRYE